MSLDWNLGTALLLLLSLVSAARPTFSASIGKPSNGTDKIDPGISIVPPGYQFKEVGSKIVFTCIIGKGLFPPGDGPLGWPEIKWKDPNQALIGEGQSRMFSERIDAYKSRMYVTKVEEDDAGLYTCEVLTRDGVMYITSNNLFIYSDIQFATTLTRVEALLGTNPLIGCEAIGDPQPEISWKFNGRKIPKNSKGHFEIQMTGLRIRNLEVSDNGTYECRAQVPSQGNFKNMKIDLSVLYAPIISLPMYSPTVLKGTDAQLQCQATGNPAITYEWFKGNPKSGQRLYRGSESMYVLKEVSEDAEGEYTCVARNKYGTQEGTADLRVSVSPTVKVPQQVMMVLEGKNLVLSCEAISSPQASFHWSRSINNKTLTYFSNGTSGKSDERVSTLTTDIGVSRLRIKGILRSDEGNYTCTAINIAGNDSKDIKVVVDYAPSVYSKTDLKVYAWSGQERVLTCEAFGQPLPTIAWLRNGKTYLDSTPHHIITHDKVTPNGITSSLKLIIDKQLENSLYGNYSCMAKNIHNYDSKIISLMKSYPPELPRNVSVNNITHDSFSLKTIESTNISSTDPSIPPVNTWIVECKKTQSFLSSSSSPLSSSSLSSLLLSPSDKDFKEESILKTFDVGQLMTVNGLESNTEYLVLVSARNQVGKSGAVKFNIKTDKFLEDELFQADQGLMSKSSLSRQEHLRLSKNNDGKKKSFWDGLSVGLVVVVAGLLTVLTTAVLALAIRNWKNNDPSKSGKYRIGSPGLERSQFDYSKKGQQVRVTDEHDIDNLTLKTNRPATSVNDDSPFADLQNRYGSLPKKFGEGAKVIRPFDVVNNNVNDDSNQQQQNIGKVSCPLSSTLPRSRKMEVHVNRTASVMQMIEERKTKQSQAWKEMLKLTTADLDEDLLMTKGDEEDGNNTNEDDNNAEDEGVFEEGQNSNLPPPPSDMLASPVNTPNFVMQEQPCIASTPITSNVNVRCKQGPFDASHIEDEDDISFIDDDDEDDDVVITHHSVSNNANRKVQFEGRSFKQY